MTANDNAQDPIALLEKIAGPLGYEVTEKLRQQIIFTQERLEPAQNAMATLVTRVALPILTNRLFRDTLTKPLDGVFDSPDALARTVQELLTDADIYRNEDAKKRPITPQNLALLETLTNGKPLTEEDVDTLTEALFFPTNPNAFRLPMLDENRVNGLDKFNKGSAQRGKLLDEYQTLLTEYVNQNPNDTEARQHQSTLKIFRKGDADTFPETPANFAQSSKRAEKLTALFKKNNTLSLHPYTKKLNSISGHIMGDALPNLLGIEDSAELNTANYPGLSLIDNGGKSLSNFIWKLLARKGGDFEKLTDGARVAATLKDPADMPRLIKTMMRAAAYMPNIEFDKEKSDLPEMYATGTFVFNAIFATKFDDGKILGEFKIDAEPLRRVESLTHPAYEILREIQKPKPSKNSPEGKKYHSLDEFEHLMKDYNDVFNYVKKDSPLTKELREKSRNDCGVLSLDLQFDGSTTPAGKYSRRDFTMAQTLMAATTDRTENAEGKKLLTNAEQEIMDELIGNLQSFQRDVYTLSVRGTKWAAWYLAMAERSSVPLSEYTTLLKHDMTRTEGKDISRYRETYAYTDAEDIINETAQLMQAYKEGVITYEAPVVTKGLGIHEKCHPTFVDRILAVKPRSFAISP